MTDPMTRIQHEASREGSYPIAYKQTIGARVLEWFIGLLLASVGIGLLLLLPPWSLLPRVCLLMGSIALGMLALACYCICDAIRADLTVGVHTVEIRKGFTTLRIGYAEIVGRRTRGGRKSIYLRLVLKNGRSVAINRSSFGLDDRFDRWFNALTDLDQQARLASLSLIRNDASLGLTEHERLAKLAQANRLGKGLGYVLLILLAWAVVYPRPYGLGVACAAVLPWFAVTICWARPNLFRFTGDPTDARVNLLGVVIMASFALAMRAMFDLTLIDQAALFLWSLMLAVPLWGAIVAARKLSPVAANGRWLVPLISLFAALGYGVSVLAFVDTMWDQAEPGVFQTVITGKDEYRGYGRGALDIFTLDLAPWNGNVHRNSIDVSRNYFESVRKDDIVCVSLHPGRFGLRWMRVGSCS